MMLAATVLLENSRWSPADGKHDDERLQQIRHTGDLAEQHPRQPPCGAALEDDEPERQPGDDQHDAAPLDIVLGLLPASAPDAGQEQREAAGERDRFDRRRERGRAVQRCKQRRGQPQR